MFQKKNYIDLIGGMRSCVNGVCTETKQGPDMTFWYLCACGCGGCGAFAILFHIFSYGKNCIDPEKPGNPPDPNCKKTYALNDGRQITSLVFMIIYFILCMVFCVCGVMGMGGNKEPAPDYSISG